MNFICGHQNNNPLAGKFRVQFRIAPDMLIVKRDFSEVEGSQKFGAIFVERARERESWRNLRQNNQKNNSGSVNCFYHELLGKEYFFQRVWFFCWRKDSEKILYENININN
ncbi:MAG: hypothetical protein LBT50_02610 [Prevotellaceae bacterium]|jgi:hypothetical protein|nr:hypothetical protein [Prevotellaceae bacterium]